MRVTKRKLAAILRESVFAPSQPGPLKIIADVDNTEYYVRRAIELCRIFLEEASEDTEPLAMAISLLALARYHAENKE